MNQVVDVSVASFAGKQTVSEGTNESPSSNIARELLYDIITS